MVTIELQSRELERKEVQLRILDENLQSQGEDLAIEINQKRDAQDQFEGERKINDETESKFLNFRKSHYDLVDKMRVVFDMGIEPPTDQQIEEEVYRVTSQLRSTLSLLDSLKEQMQQTETDY